MENKINIADLLRNCPQGMELDCTCADNVVFDKIIEYEQIKCVIGECRDPLILDKYGRLLHICCPKCVIFPKGKTTWEEFVQPVEFKDGDIIFTHANCLKVGLGNTWISIFQEKRNGGVATYVDYAEDGKDYADYMSDKGLLCMDKAIIHQRLATEEEKEKLFKAIKDKGYRWNPETKTLVKLPKFKIGDEIVKKNSITNSYIVSSVSCDYYGLKLPNNTGVGVLKVDEQDEWELVPHKFDIKTLKPFDKVLVRDFDNTTWEIDFFSKLLGGRHFKCLDLSYVQCIPYKGNEHLFDTTNKCDEFYVTWES